jgi:hypothetical protein
VLVHTAGEGMLPRRRSGRAAGWITAYRLLTSLVGRDGAIDYLASRKSPEACAPTGAKAHANELNSCADKWGKAGRVAACRQTNSVLSLTSSALKRGSSSGR